MDEYRSKTIDEATPLEALVGIGDDATASILIFEDDLDVLNRLVLGGGDDRLY